MIVHLFNDEKFVDSTIYNFQKYSKVVNKYFIFSNSKRLRYVNNYKDIKIVSNSCYNLDLDEIYNHCKLLIIHYLTPKKLFVIKNKPKDVKVIWSVWGSDAYDHFKSESIYEPKTLSYFNKSMMNSFRATFLYTMYHFLRFRIQPISKEIDILKKIEYLSTVIPDEFQLVNNEFNLNAKYIPLSYHSSNFKNSSKFTSLGNSVLLGNSATLSNNHFDAFELLKVAKDINFIMPLSYGAKNFKYYRNLIVSRARKKLKNINPLLSFITLNDYINKLNACNSIIMYHKRQQALGNIYLALYTGQRVFLNTKSVTYKYLIKKGFFVFSLENDIKLLSKNLEINKKNINREIVIKLRGIDAVKKMINGINRLHSDID